MHITELPPEIIEEIFAMVVYSGHSSWPHTPSYLSEATPYAISHVCQQWRKIALNYSYLWTHLFIKGPRTEELVSLLKLWLHRAGNKPLYLVLHEVEIAFEFKKAMKAVLTLFINSIHRCKSFEIVVKSQSAHIIDITRLRAQPAVLLETLIIKGLDDHVEGSLLPTTREAEFLFYILLNGPKLRSLTWENGYKNSIVEASRWKSLQELILDTAEVVPLISALSFCQSLERLTIHGKLRLSLQEPNKSNPIILPSLTHLSFILETRSGSLLACLNLPSLKEINILRVESSGWAEIINLLETSAVNLQVLRAETENVRRSFRRGERRLLRALQTHRFQDLKVLEIKFSLGLDTIKFLTLSRLLPLSHTTAEDAPSHDENPLELRFGYLPYLERISLAFVFELQDVDVSKDLWNLVESRLGFSDDATMRRCVEWIGFSGQTARLCLDIPPSVESP